MDKYIYAGVALLLCWLGGMVSGVWVAITGYRRRHDTGTAPNAGADDIKQSADANDRRAEQLGEAGRDVNSRTEQTIRDIEGSLQTIRDIVSDIRNGSNNNVSVEGSK